MLLDLKKQLLNDFIHVLHNILSTYVFIYLFRVFCIEDPIRMNFGYILELMIKMVVI